LHPIQPSGEADHSIWIIGLPVEGPHYYTHALPRTGFISRQTKEAENCVLELFKQLEQELITGVVVQSLTSFKVNEGDR
jgi:hypothetical protein